MLSVSWHASGRWAFLYRKADTGSLTCATILVRAVHTKVRQALTCLLKCCFVRTEKRSFTQSRPGVEPTGSPAQRANHWATAPVVWEASVLLSDLASRFFYSWHPRDQIPVGRFLVSSDFEWEVAFLRLQDWQTEMAVMSRWALGCVSGVYCTGSHRVVLLQCMTQRTWCCQSFGTSCSQRENHPHTCPVFPVEIGIHAMVHGRHRVSMFFSPNNSRISDVIINFELFHNFVFFFWISHRTL